MKLEVGYEGLFGLLLEEERGGCHGREEKGSKLNKCAATYTHISAFLPDIRAAQCSVLRVTPALETMPRLCELWFDGGAHKGGSYERGGIKGGAHFPQFPADNAQTRYRVMEGYPMFTGPELGQGRGTPPLGAAWAATGGT